MSPLRLFAAIALLVLGAPGAAEGTSTIEPCATSRLYCAGWQTFTTSNGQLTCSGGNASFNLVDILLTASGGTARVESADDYQVEGPPVGTPLTLTCRMSAFAASGVGYDGCGSAEVLVSGPSGDVRLVASCDASRTETLELVVPVVVGQTFRLAYFIAASGGTGWGWASMSSLQFDGLPPGARVTSCHGFSQEAPVPVQAGSWGSLKATYR
jgi:hypothetical protein